MKVVRNSSGARKVFESLKNYCWRLRRAKKKQLLAVFSSAINEVKIGHPRHTIHLRNRYPENPIETIRVDGAEDYGSDLFAEFSQSLGITLENSAPDEHDMNGLAESHIKSFQIVARTMLMQSNLPADCWGHAILHANDLLNRHPLANGTESPAYLEMGHAPNVSHLRRFGCAILHPIPPTKRTKMGPQRAMGIYVGFQSPAIAKYLDPVNGNLFHTKFTDCIFLENSFPPLSGDNVVRNSERLQAELLFPTKTETHSHPNDDDPPTNKRHEEIARVINLHHLALGQPDAFADIPPRMIHPGSMAPAQVSTTNTKRAHKSEPRIRKGRQPALDNTNLKRKIKDVTEPIPISKLRITEAEETSDEPTKLKPKIKIVYNKEQLNPENLEMPNQNEHPPIGIHTEELFEPTESHNIEELPLQSYQNRKFVNVREKGHIRRLTKPNDIFAFNVATQIMHEEEEDRKYYQDAINSVNAEQWKEAIKADYDSLYSHGTFGEPQEAPDTPWDAIDGFSFERRMVMVSLRALKHALSLKGTRNVGVLTTMRPTVQ